MHFVLCIYWLMCHWHVNGYAIRFTILCLRTQLCEGA